MHDPARATSSQIARHPENVGGWNTSNLKTNKKIKIKTPFTPLNSWVTGLGFYSNLRICTANRCFDATQHSSNHGAYRNQQLIYVWVPSDTPLSCVLNLSFGLFWSCGEHETVSGWFCTSQFTSKSGLNGCVDYHKLITPTRYPPRLNDEEKGYIYLVMMIINIHQRVKESTEFQWRLICRSPLSLIYSTVLY